MMATFRDTLRRDVWIMEYMLDHGGASPILKAAVLEMYKNSLYEYARSTAVMGAYAEQVEKLDKELSDKACNPYRNMNRVMELEKQYIPPEWFEDVELTDDIDDPATQLWSDAVDAWEEEQYEVEDDEDD